MQSESGCAASIRQRSEQSSLRVVVTLHETHTGHWVPVLFDLSGSRLLFPEVKHHGRLRGLGFN